MECVSEKAKWEAATIEAYKPIKDDEGWLECPKCRRKPRVWIFDNGNYAKCQCSKKYDPAIEYQSIGDYFRQFKTCEGYSNVGLKNVWNEHVKLHALSTAFAQLKEYKETQVELF